MATYGHYEMVAGMANVTIQLKRVVSERKIFPLFHRLIDGSTACIGLSRVPNHTSNTASKRQNSSGTAVISLVPFLHPWSDGWRGASQVFGSLIGVAIKVRVRT